MGLYRSWISTGQLSGKVSDWSCWGPGFDSRSIHMFSMFYMLIPPFLLHVYIYFSVSTIHVTPKIAVDFIYILYTRFFSRYFNILWFFVLFIQKTNVEISISCMIYSSFVFTPRRFHFPVGFFDLDLTDFNCYLFEVGALNSIVIHVHVFHFPF